MCKKYDTGISEETMIVFEGLLVRGFWHIALERYALQVLSFYRRRAKVSNDNEKEVVELLLKSY